MVLDGIQHTSFLRIFGHNLLNSAQDATPKQVRCWVDLHYPQRYQFAFYEQFNSILRMLTSALVKKHWPHITEEVLADLAGYARQARDSETEQ